MAVAALAVLIPLSGLAVTQRLVHNYKVKPVKHPHVKIERHKDVHGKQFADSVKARAKHDQELRKKGTGDEFGVHKEQ